MEPLSPNDPVLKLLGKGKPVEPRPNFTQNVLRAIRQEPQRETLWERVRYWFAEGGTPKAAWAGSAVAAVLAVAMWSQTIAPEGPSSTHAPSLAQTQKQKQTSPVIAETSTGILEEASAEAMASSEPAAVASEFESMDQLSLLLAQQDTSALTDNEIALLLY